MTLNLNFQIGGMNPPEPESEVSMADKFQYLGQLTVSADLVDKTVLENYFGDNLSDHGFPSGISGCTKVHLEWVDIVAKDAIKWNGDDPSGDMTDMLTWLIGKVRETYPNFTVSGSLEMFGLDSNNVVEESAEIVFPDGYQAKYVDRTPSQQMTPGTYVRSGTSDTFVHQTTGEAVTINLRSYNFANIARA